MEPENLATWHAMAERIRQERDEARTERDALRAEASSDREHIRRLRRERDELREAARALLAELPKAALQCRNCDDLATHCWPSPAGGVRFACDAHNVDGSTEMDHAAPLRRLRELTKEGK